MPAEEINPGQYCKVVNIAQAGLLSRAILGSLQESRFRRRSPGFRRDLRSPLGDSFFSEVLEKLPFVDSLFRTFAARFGLMWAYNR
jgi:hypothetical protein